MRGSPRRLVAAAAVVALVAATAWIGIARPWQSGNSLTPVTATDPAVAAAEDARRTDTAAVQTIDLTAAPATVDLGDRTVDTWAFNGTVPGPEIRLRAGDVVRAAVRNDLPAPLTIHWHGIALRNDMDGVPALTQPAIEPGGSFVYEFTAPDPGTYFYHPHTGTQLDRGLYAPLVVEGPAAGGERDITLMLDDWIDGTGETPDEVLDRLQEMSNGMSGMGHDMGGMDMSTMDHGNGMATAPDQPLGTDTGDVNYPLYLINGRPATNAAAYEVAAGSPIRLRLVNAGSDTPFRVALGGQQLTVVATDGFPVEPVTVDSLIIGMGERYDVVTTIDAVGAVPLVARAEGKTGQALAILRTGPGAAPAADVNPPELTGRLLQLDELVAADDVALPGGRPDRDYRVELTGAMSPYDWGISATSQDGTTLPVRKGERVRLTIENQTMMWHPIHLHGHTFQVVSDNGGPRKDTVIVPPMGRVTVELAADNPGQWALHCHNIYHAEVGMVTVLSYVT